MTLRRKLGWIGDTVRLPIHGNVSFGKVVTPVTWSARVTFILSTHVVLCFVRPRRGSQHKRLRVGLAYRSFPDKWDQATGERLSFGRAVEGMRGPALHAAQVARGVAERRVDFDGSVIPSWL